MKTINKAIIFIGMVLIGMMSAFQMNAEAASTETEEKVSVKNGMTEKVYAYKDAIIEDVYVETSFDSDKDGKKDRVHAKIIRPAETKKGSKVPVIYNISPYNDGLDYPDYHNVDKELYKGIPLHLPDYYEEYFVSRGYAVVIADSIGSAGSNGCPSAGGKYEILGAKSIVDWLNNRTKGYNENEEEMVADWTTGNVGLIGKSYDGSIANGLATTGVEGLKTIVPISGISSWYDYYRANGAVIAPGGYQGDGADLLAKGVLTRENPKECAAQMEKIEKDQDRETGDYNAFWDERNYLNDANKVQASVFIVHGLNDINVKAKQFDQWWAELKKNDVPRKLLLHQGEHIDPKKKKGDEWLTTLNKWFGHWLYGINNGIMKEPGVEIQNRDLSWEQLEEWPRKKAEDKKLYLNGSGELSLKRMEGGTKSSFIDDASKTAKELIKNPSSQSENRLAYISSELTEPIRLSGTPHLSVTASIDATAANLSALLVDYGPEKATIVTRGWMDPQNVNSISTSEKLIPNKEYNFEWDMEPYDYQFSEGHQIGLVIISSDHEYTKRPEPGTKITILPEKSSATLPLVGQLSEEKKEGNTDTQSESKKEETAQEQSSTTTPILILITIGIVVAGIILFFISKRKKGK
ncbi:Xaa-Pro dipeptidyl-peptidase [Paraliobacillus sp. PM-2]|uniref:Xaa-Pro dipeptidyl-peptidase n=1 Tax=Paraliobacillus sp. PM-2 TaxID=1462524 RepID=UPI00061BAAAA|nr:Xaa-Pro dipeptidyl-peptidase [Paraliobacillus sp. PM-2]CQR47432.1 Xaa-Pro dipeptidyl-peptidase [Paraliobacillus sp. PM-2]